jgi:hypothetical protein
MAPLEIVPVIEHPTPLPYISTAPPFPSTYGLSGSINRHYGGTSFLTEDPTTIAG